MQSHPIQPVPLSFCSSPARERETGTDPSSPVVTVCQGLCPAVASVHQPMIRRRTVTKQHDVANGPGFRSRDFVTIGQSDGLPCVSLLPRKVGVLCMLVSLSAWCNLERGRGVSARGGRVYEELSGLPSLRAEDPGWELGAPVPGRESQPNTEHAHIHFSLPLTVARV